MEESLNNMGDLKDIEEEISKDKKKLNKYKVIIPIILITVIIVFFL